MYKSIEPVDPRLFRVIQEKRSAAIKLSIWGVAVGGTLVAFLGINALAWTLGGGNALVISGGNTVLITFCIWLYVLKKVMKENPITRYLNASRSLEEISNAIAWEEHQKRQEELNKIVGEWYE